MQIRRFNDEDFIRYDDICKYMVFSLGIDNADYFIYQSNGEEKVLCKKDNKCYYFVMGEDKKLDCRSFIYDQEGKITDYTTSKYEVTAGENTSSMIDRTTGNVEMIKVIPTKRFASDKNCNMLIAYSQYNRNIEENMILFYKYFKRDNYVLLNVMKPLEKPANIMFQKIFNGEVIAHRQFILKEYREGNLDYDMLAVKEYGISNYLEKKAFALHKSSVVGRYESTLPYLGNITGFPFTRSFTDKDMRIMIKNRGYNYMIPEEAMKVFNGGYEYMDEIKEIALQLVKREEKELKKSKKND